MQFYAILTYFSQRDVGQPFPLYAIMAIFLVGHDTMDIENLKSKTL